MRCWFSGGPGNEFSSSLFCRCFSTPPVFWREVHGDKFFYRGVSRNTARGFCGQVKPFAGMVIEAGVAEVGPDAAGGEGGGGADERRIEMVEARAQPHGEPIELRPEDLT